MHDEFSDVSTRIRGFKGTFWLSITWTISGTSEIHSICTEGIVYEETRKNTRTSNTGTTRYGQNGQMVQQLHHSTKWHSTLMSRLCKTQPGILRPTH